MTRLLNYDANQIGKTPSVELTSAGVACTEKGCSGEMGYTNPRHSHPQLPDLARALCMSCGWRGWV